MLSCRVLNKSDKELQDAFALRYAVFYEEHDREPDDATLDHKAHTLVDELDKRPSTVILGVIHEGKVVATTRQVVLTAQDFINTDVSLTFIDRTLRLKQFFSAAKKHLPSANLRVLYGGRTCVHKEYRKFPQLMPLLFREAYLQPQFEGIHLFFTCVVTGFLNTTYAVGYRQCGSPYEYGVPFVLVNHTKFRNQIPLPLPSPSSSTKLLECLEEVYAPFLDAFNTASQNNLYSPFFGKQLATTLSKLVCPIKMKKGDVLNFVYGEQNSQRGMLVVLEGKIEVFQKFQESTLVLSTEKDSIWFSQQGRACCVSDRGMIAFVPYSTVPASQYQKKAML